jgi:hypothetical protein
LTKLCLQRSRGHHHHFNANFIRLFIRSLLFTQGLNKETDYLPLNFPFGTKQCSKWAGIPHRNLFLFLYFIPALINIYYTHWPCFSDGISLVHFQEVYQHFERWNERRTNFITCGLHGEHKHFNPPPPPKRIEFACSEPSEAKAHRNNKNSVRTAEQTCCLMLFRGIITVYSETRGKHNTKCHDC